MDQQYGALRGSCRRRAINVMDSDFICVVDKGKAMLPSVVVNLCDIERRHVGGKRYQLRCVRVSTELSVVAGDSKHIHIVDLLIMTSLRGQSIRVIVRQLVGSSAGMMPNFGELYLSHMALGRPFSKVAIFSASRLDFVLVSAKNSPRSRT
jgi:hypothetical protein